MLKTLELKDRTEKKKALSLGNGNGTAQSLEVDSLVYCTVHGFVKAIGGTCAECYDAGYQDWLAIQSVKSLIPAWTGIEPDGRQVIVARVKDAVGAIEAISRYKGSDAIILIKWGNVITVLDHGRIGPSYAVADGAEQRGPLP